MILPFFVSEDVDTYFTIIKLNLNGYQTYSLGSEEINESGTTFPSRSLLKSRTLYFSCISVKNFHR